LLSLLSTVLTAHHWREEPEAEAMQVQLVVKSSSEPTPRDYIFRMKERVVLGRSPESAVPLEGTAISREHLVLELNGDKVYATDLSNNGTWVNGNRLKREEPIQLSSGDA